MDSSNMFVNTMSPCNVHIAAQGMDFDGDSVPNRGIFTTEANIDAVNFSRDKKNFKPCRKEYKNYRKRLCTINILSFQTTYNR